MSAAVTPEKFDAAWQALIDETPTRRGGGYIVSVDKVETRSRSRSPRPSASPARRLWLDAITRRIRLEDIP